MQCKIVYLQPRTSFRARLHSDTLWGQLCWGIQMVYDSKRLDDLLKAYEEGDLNNTFFISSAYPFRWHQGKRVCYFPEPLTPIPGTEKLSYEKDAMTFAEKKIKLREQKKAKKRNWQSREQFEYHYAGGPAPGKAPKSPREAIVPITHNTIDRLTGSTLQINRQGQLYHTNEHYLLLEEDENTGSGLFFLLAGRTEEVERALYFLEHFGMGGDRSIGKGSYHIQIQDFEIQEPKDWNAWVNLSLYRPLEAEVAKMEALSDRLLNYKIVDRQGKGTVWQPNVKKRRLLFFEEGAVFPAKAFSDDQRFRGFNEIVAKHEMGFNIRHYGIGMMLKVKIR